MNENSLSLSLSFAPYVRFVAYGSVIIAKCNRQTKYTQREIFDAVTGNNDDSDRARLDTYVDMADDDAMIMTAILLLLEMVNVLLC